MTKQELMKKIIAYNQSLKGLELECNNVSSYIHGIQVMLKK